MTTTATEPTAATTNSSTPPAALRYVDVAVIDNDPNNASRPLTADFTASVRKHGVIMPILLRPGPDGRFRLIAGERRVLAAKTAGLASVPAIIRTDADDRRAGVLQTVENLHRAALAPSHEAMAVARSMAEGMRQKELAAELNRPASWVRTRVALAGLSENVQAAIDRGDFEISDALVFAKYAARPDAIEVVLDPDNRFVRRNDLDWSLSRAAELIDRANTIVERSDEHTAADLVAFRDRLPHEIQSVARQLDELDGIEPKAHRSEPCHVVVVTAEYDGHVVDRLYCVEPKRHTAKGDSTLTVTKPIGRRSMSESERRAADKAKAERAVTRHRDTFAAAAIGAKIRTKDVAAMALPILLDVAGQTELTEAAKLLKVTEPTQRTGDGWKDWATPFKQWALESSANTHRAMVAIAYVQASRHLGISYRPVASDTLTAWLKDLGYAAADHAATA